MWQLVVGQLWPEKLAKPEGGEQWVTVWPRVGLFIGENIKAHLTEHKANKRDSLYKLPHRENAYQRIPSLSKHNSR